jgi:hypothetical protein
MMDHRHRVVADEARTLSSGVPGRSRRQLAFLDENAICPTLFRQVIEEPDPHHSATDDDNSCV